MGELHILSTVIAVITRTKEGSETAVDPSTSLNVLDANGAIFHVRFARNKTKIHRLGHYRRIAPI